MGGIQVSAETTRTEKNNIAAPLCACGCGNDVSRSAANKTRWNKFIHGHNGRNIPRPDYVRAKISKSRMGVGAGERRSPSTEFKPGQRVSPETEFKPGNKIHLGKKRSQDFRHRMVVRYRNKRYTAGCDYCGKPVSVTAYRVAHNNYVFCDRACSSAHYSGANSYFWKGGITPENEAIRGSAEAVAWKRAVMSRDGYRCYLCGAGGRLHAHHIYPFAEFEKLRFDVDNGITLCPKCHRWCHAEEISPIVYKVSQMVGII